MTTEEFVAQHKLADVNALALKMRQYPEVDAAFALQQIEGFQKAQHKLPEIAAIEVWYWPKRLSLEQCSSEVTAKYKQLVLRRELTQEGGNYGRPENSNYRSPEKGSLQNQKDSSPIIQSKLPKIEPTLPIIKSTTPTLKNNYTLWDLTGGMGIDTFYLSELFGEVHYVERQEELCQLAAHNFGLTDKPVEVHHATAEEFLQETKGSKESNGANGLNRLKGLNGADEANGTARKKEADEANGTARMNEVDEANGTARMNEVDEANGTNESHEITAGRTVIFMDPARRDSHGGKVFRLQDCEPDVTALLPLLFARASVILLKLSPMLDITEAVRSLGGAAEVHVVAVKNEVKEVLILLKASDNSFDPEIHCVNLETDDAPFVFRRSEEMEAEAEITKNPCSIGEEFVLLEPNAAIQKAGAFKLFATRYGAKKLGVNTHLYFMEKPSGEDGKCGEERGEKLIEEKNGKSGEKCSEEENGKSGEKCGGEDEKKWEDECGEEYRRSIGAPSTVLAKIAAHFAIREDTDSQTSLDTKDQKFIDTENQTSFVVPARVFVGKVAAKEELVKLKQANVICRNYPLSPEAVRKKYGLKDGGEKYLIATRIGDKPTLFLGMRQFLHTFE